MFSGRFFREIFLGFQEIFGGVSQAVSMEKIWEEEGMRGWKGGGEDVGEGEEKLKSAYGKNEFCDYIGYSQAKV